MYSLVSISCFPHFTACVMRFYFNKKFAEHLNIVLFELAGTYYAALQKIDVSGFGAHVQGIEPLIGY